MVHIWASYVYEHTYMGRPICVCMGRYTHMGQNTYMRVNYSYSYIRTYNYAITMYVMCMCGCLCHTASAAPDNGGLGLRSKGGMAVAWGGRPTTPKAVCCAVRTYVRKILGDRVTLRDIIYYIKTKSRLSVRLSPLFFCTHFDPWFQFGSTPDLLEMKRPSSEITISIFFKVLIAVVRRLRHFECHGVDDFLLNLKQNSCKPQPRRN